MRRLICVCTFLAFLCAAGAAAEPSLLPDHAGVWQASGPAKSLKVQDLGPAWVAGTSGALVLAESGLRQITEQTYRNGAEAVTLRVFTLRDPSRAFEFYTYLLTPGMKTLGAGEETALSEDGGRFLIGNLVVQAAFSPKLNPESLTSLLEAVKSRADPTPLPQLKNYLPTRWRVSGSEKYTLGPEGFRAAMKSLDQGALAELANAVGFQSDVEAILAKYQGERGRGILLLIEYPTPQLAEQHLHHLEEALPEEAKKAGVTVERKASLLSLVLAPTSAQHAQAIRNEVNYETEVTWNESSHTATDPPIVLVMVKIFLFTGVFLGVATAVGVAFGGLRVIIKRLFPGKVFDRPEDIEVLQLGLSGKKIDPSDMY